MRNVGLHQNNERCNTHVGFKNNIRTFRTRTDRIMDLVKLKMLYKALSTLAAKNGNYIVAAIVTEIGDYSVDRA